MPPTDLYTAYPEPVEAPITDEEAAEYKPVPTNNPTVSGLTLSILSKVYVIDALLRCLSPS